MIFTRLLREQKFSAHFLVILSKLFNARFIFLEILNVMITIYCTWFKNNAITHHAYYAMTQ